ncbi:MAG: DUF6427 family protein [Bacteroidota bacterium]
MLRFYKSNHPLVVVLVLLSIGLLHFYTFYLPVSAADEFVNPLSRALLWVLHFIPLNQTLLENCLSILLLFVQALYFNSILDKHKIVDRGNYLGAYIYVVLSCMFRNFLFLSPALIGNLFLLVEIDLLFSVFKKEKASSQIFDLGFFIAASSLFYFPSLAFLLFLFIGMLILRPLKIGEWFVLLIGVLVPYFLSAVYFFWYDRLPEFFSNITFRRVMNEEFGFVTNLEVLVISAIVLVALVWSVLKIQTHYFKTLVQIRNYFVVLLVFSLLGFPSVFLQSSIRIENFIWLVIPVATALTYSVPLLKKEWIAEIFHLTLLLLILYFQFEKQLSLFE